MREMKFREGSGAFPSELGNEGRQAMELRGQVCSQMEFGNKEAEYSCYRGMRGGGAGSCVICLPFSGSYSMVSLHLVWCEGGLAQLVERLVRNEKVRGSNPLSSTLTFSIFTETSARVFFSPDHPETCASVSTASFRLWMTARLFDAFAEIFYGWVISAGLTVASNSSPVRRPSLMAVARRVAFSLWAVLAILAALS